MKTPKVKEEEIEGLGWNNQALINSIPPELSDLHLPHSFVVWTGEWIWMFEARSRDLMRPFAAQASVYLSKSLA